MRARTLLTTLSLACFLSGCIVYETPTSVIIEPVGPYIDPCGLYIDTYLHIPVEVARLIEKRVDGYHTPPLSRYSNELYEYEGVRTSSNRPPYVRADFNGDYKDDYAFLFSKEEYYGGSWWITTKLLVVVSNRRGGYDLSMELVLGTVTAPMYIPVEEFWSIGLMRRGHHTITTIYNDRTIEESVFLDNDSFRLISLDPSENSIFYVINTETYEIAWDRGTLMKRKAGVDTSRSQRVIHLNEIREKE